jgi:hypothetical protein
VEISTVGFRGRSYQVILDAHGFPKEIKREGVSKHQVGHWVRIWHRRQGSPGRQSVVVAGVLRISEQMTDIRQLAASAEAGFPPTAQDAPLAAGERLASHRSPVHA